jgi:hypothetical protein
MAMPRARSGAAKPVSCVTVTHRRHRRPVRTVIGLAVLATAVMLAVPGCAPASSAGTGPVPAYAQTLAQAQATFAAYVRTSAAAAAAGDEASGLSDVADAQWAQVKGQYITLAHAGTPVPQYRYGTPRFYLPPPAGFPHWFVVAVNRRSAVSSLAGPVVPTVMVFERAKADKPWALAGTAGLAQPLPAVARLRSGYVIAPASTDPGVLLRPDVVGPTQAAVVDEGPANPSAAVIAAGPQTTGLYAAQSARARAQRARGLVYTWLLQGAPFPQFQLRLQDGADLVLYGMYLNISNTHPNQVKGAPIPVPAGFTPLLAAPTEVGYHGVYADWTDEFAAIDPPAATRGARVTIIGASAAPSYGHAY